MGHGREDDDDDDVALRRELSSNQFAIGFTSTRTGNKGKKRAATLNWNWPSVYEA